MTRRTINTVPLVIVGIFLTASCALAKPYVSRQGYTITPPADWTVSGRSTTYEVMFAAPPVNGIPPNINVVVGKGVPIGAEKASLPVALAAIRQHYPQSFSGYSEIAAGYTTLGGLKGASITATWTAGPQAIPLEVHQVFFLRNGRSYTFTCTAATDVYNDYLPAFVACLRSIHWTTPTQKQRH